MQLIGTEIFRPNLRDLEAVEKNFTANLYDAQGTTYYALVKAPHFPAAYAKAKRTATDQGFRIGHIAQV